MDNTKLINAISKTVQLLNRSYKQTQDLKRRFLNHPKILQYFFQKTIVKVSTLQRGVQAVKDDVMPKIDVEFDKTAIDSMFIDLYKSLGEYQIDYERYRILAVKYHQQTGRKLNLAKRLDFIPKITSLTRAVQKVLERLKSDYLPNWSFSLEDEQLTVHEMRPYSFKTDLRVDFLCYQVHRNRLIFYAILVDGDQLTVGDYLKQYFLQQMNIHLLRLKSDSNIVLEIKTFLNLIKKTNQYVIKNGLDASTFKYSTKALLTQFYEDYQYNHINCLKYCLPDEDDDEITNYSEKPVDDAYTAPSNILKILTDKKFIFTKKKN